MTEPRVAVFGSSQTKPGSEEWVAAEFVGRSLAESGISVVTGGYGGTMEAVSMGAVEHGGEAIGVTASPLFPLRAGANDFVSIVEDTSSLAERIGRMVELSSGCIVLPGSIGTAAELVVVWNINHVLRKSSQPNGIPVVAVGSQWQAFGQFMTQEMGAIEDGVHWTPTAKLAVSWIVEQLDP